MVPSGSMFQTVDTLAPKYPHRDYFKAKVSTIRVHGPSGFRKKTLKAPKDSYFRAFGPKGHAI